jgi:ABC-type amino acid transport substrate-binding protein
MLAWRIFSVVLLLGLLQVEWGIAQPRSLSAKTLIVGTKQAPPFVMKQPDGTWHGISIDLWHEIATELGLTYELREFDLQGLLNGVQNRTLDLAVAALTITPEREKVMDFTHAFYMTGFGIALPQSHRGGWFSYVRLFVSWRLLQAISGLVLLLLVVGVVVWLTERKKNPQQFNGGLKGIWSGFWWAAVTMTTVGYGDKAPRTVGGQILALVWMFAGLMIISSFIAAITTALTVSHLTSAISGPDDLVRSLVATVPGSTSENYLRQQRMTMKRYATPREGLQALARGEVDAMIYDAPLLHYLVSTDDMQGKVEVLPMTFDQQAYGMALPTGSPLREPINWVLLAKIRQPGWQDILYRYLGK